MDVQLTIRLPADLSEALQRATRVSGLRTSDIVRGSPEARPRASILFWREVRSLFRRARTLFGGREFVTRLADCPMDFADATLVVLAEDLATNLILTTGQCDFSVYRIASRRRLAHSRDKKAREDE